MVNGIYQEQTVVQIYAMKETHYFDRLLTLGAGYDKLIIDILATSAQNKDSLFWLDTRFMVHSLYRHIVRVSYVTTTTCRFSS